MPTTRALMTLILHIIRRNWSISDINFHEISVLDRSLQSCTQTVFCNYFFSPSYHLSSSPPSYHHLFLQLVIFKKQQPLSQGKPVSFDPQVSTLHPTRAICWVSQGTWSMCPGAFDSDEWWLLHDMVAISTRGKMCESNSKTMMVEKIVV